MFGNIIFIIRLAIAALFVYGVYDVRRDVIALSKTRKLNGVQTTGINEADSVEDVVQYLQGQAPGIRENPFTWTVYDEDPQWFEELGDITAIALKETGNTLVARISRGSTLVDEVTFSINGNRIVSDVRVCKFYHGRPFPLFSTVSKSLNVESPTSYKRLLGNHMDADMRAIYELYQYYRVFDAKETVN